MNNSSNFPPKSRLDDDQKQQQTSSLDFRELRHELLNQLTVMNLCCSQLGTVAAKAFPSGSAEIDRMEATIVNMTTLLQNIPPALDRDTSNGLFLGNPKPATVECPNLHRSQSVRSPAEIGFADQTLEARTRTMKNSSTLEPKMAENSMRSSNGTGFGLRFLEHAPIEFKPGEPTVCA